MEASMALSRLVSLLKRNAYTNVDIQRTSYVLFYLSFSLSFSVSLLDRLLEDGGKKNETKNEEKDER